MSMYRVVKTSIINGVELPVYKGVRGSNSLEGFHKSLPDMIPGNYQSHCLSMAFN